MVCAPFECLSRNFILPEPANHVYFYAFLEFAQFIVPYLLIVNDSIYLQVLF